MYSWTGCLTEQGHLDRGKVEAEIQPACPSPAPHAVFLSKGNLLCNWHKDALWAHGNSGEARKNMTLAHSVYKGRRISWGKDWSGGVPRSCHTPEVQLGFP